jgi:hypothetical protein
MRTVEEFDQEWIKRESELAEKFIPEHLLFCEWESFVETTKELCFDSYLSSEIWEIFLSIKDVGPDDNPWVQILIGHFGKWKGYINLFFDGSMQSNLDKYAEFPHRIKQFVNSISDEICCFRDLRHIVDSSAHDRNSIAEWRQERSNQTK